MVASTPSSIAFLKAPLPLIARKTPLCRILTFKFTNSNITFALINLSSLATVPRFSNLYAYQQPRIHHSRARAPLMSSLAIDSSLFDDNLAKPVNPGLHVKVKGKYLNFWGIYCALGTFALAIFALPLMALINLYYKFNGNAKVSIFINCLCNQVH